MAAETTQTQQILYRGHGHEKVDLSRTYRGEHVSAELCCLLSVRPLVFLKGDMSHRLCLFFRALLQLELKFVILYSYN